MSTGPLKRTMYDFKNSVSPNFFFIHRAKHIFFQEWILPILLIYPRVFEIGCKWKLSLVEIGLRFKEWKNWQSIFFCSSFYKTKSFHSWIQVSKIFQVIFCLVKIHELIKNTFEFNDDWKVEIFMSTPPRHKSFTQCSAKIPV